MPVIQRSRTKYPFDELVAEIHRHLVGGENLPAFPKIYEEMTPGYYLEVTVVWGKWEHVEESLRKEIIKAAYSRDPMISRDAHISKVRGLTPLEALEELSDEVLRDLNMHPLWYLKRVINHGVSQEGNQPRAEIILDPVIHNASFF